MTFITSRKENSLLEAQYRPKLFTIKSERRWVETCLPIIWPLQLQVDVQLVQHHAAGGPHRTNPVSTIWEAKKYSLLRWLWLSKFKEKSRPKAMRYYNSVLRCILALYLFSKPVKWSFCTILVLSKLPEWNISLPFLIPKLVKTLFYTWDLKKVPLRAEPPRIGNYRDYPGLAYIVKMYAPFGQVVQV